MNIKEDSDKKQNKYFQYMDSDLKKKKKNMYFIGVHLKKESQIHMG